MGFWERVFGPTQIHKPNLAESYPLILAAICLWREARGEPREGIEAIWAVLRNRLKSRRWGNDLIDVITASYQFSSFNQSDPQVKRYPQPEDKQWLLCLDVVSKEPPNILEGSQFYYNPEVAKPSWAAKMIQVKVIGHHRFMREIQR